MMRSIRERKGLNRLQCGELIGYSDKTLRNNELGHNSPSATFIKSFIDGLGLERQEALELMDAAGFATVAGINSKAPGVNEPLPPARPASTDPEMNYQEAVCFYCLQATMSKKMDDFTAQMILKILGAL